MESQVHSMWKQFHSHIQSRQGGPEPGTDLFCTKFIDSLAQRSYCCGVKTANISSGFSWQPGWENDSE